MDQETLILLRNFSSLVIELITAIVGTLYYYKYKNSILRYFLIYLWFIVICEFSAYIMREFFGIRNNALLFNLFYLISFTYLLNTYRLVIKDSVRKKIVKYSIGTYITLFTINGFYENYLIESQTIPFIMASSFLILSVIFYFVEILGTEKVLHTKKNLLFWISVGLLLFYAGSIPFRIALNYYAKAGGFNFLFAINYLLIIILNLCFIIGFIWSNKKQLY